MSPIAEHDFGRAKQFDAGLKLTTMDDYMFKSHVQSCKNVVEATSYLEILNYSVCSSQAVFDTRAGGMKTNSKRRIHHTTAWKSIPSRTMSLRTSYIDG